MDIRDRSLATRRISVPQARRALQVVLGLLWLLDAALQFQPFMFGRGFALEILGPTADGNPSWVARPMLWSTHVVLGQPQFWNTVFALTQLLLGVGLLWRRSVKLALAGTVGWSLTVWWFGEGLGGVLTGSASPLMGAPGAVILYALLALLLWPGDDDSRQSPAEASIVRRVAPLAWLLLWGSEAYFALLPANDSPAALHGMLAGMVDGEPRPIAAIDRFLARLVAHHSILGPGLGALFALCALAVFVPPRLARPLYGLAMLLATITWVGQDFGGILTGQATDPNSGPLLFLLALAYWPTARISASAQAAPSRPPRLRTGIAVAATALVAAGSVAAATGLTTETATVSSQHNTLTMVSAKRLGPGPIRSRYHLGHYRLLFHARANRATHPVVLSVQLARRGQPANHARITVIYRSLDMPMIYALTLASRGDGRYSARGPALGMGGRWRITISILPRHRQPLRLSLTDLITL